MRERGNGERGNDGTENEIVLSVAKKRNNDEERLCGRRGEGRTGRIGSGTGI